MNVKIHINIICEVFVRLGALLTSTYRGQQEGAVGDTSNLIDDSTAQTNRINDPRSQSDQGAQNGSMGAQLNTLDPRLLEIGEDLEFQFLQTGENSN